MPVLRDLQGLQGDRCRRVLLHLLWDQEQQLALLQLADKAAARVIITPACAAVKDPAGTAEGLRGCSRGPEGRDSREGKAAADPYAGRAEQVCLQQLHLVVVAGVRGEAAVQGCSSCSQLGLELRLVYLQKGGQGGRKKCRLPNISYDLKAVTRQCMCHNHNKVRSLSREELL